MLVLTLLLFVSTLWESHAVLEKHKFKTWKGYKLYNGTEINKFNVKNMSLALCASLCTGDCESATFSRTLNQCVTFKDRVYDSSIKRINDLQWYILYKNAPVEFGKWTLVFRTQRDTNQSLYDLWTSTGTADDNPLSVDFPVKCLQLTYSNTCKRHYRSFILDQWVNIDMVKFSLYRNGSEVKNILFNGKSSTRTSWFKKANIINSTWGNMKYDSSISNFSVAGLDDGNSERRFAINGVYNGCENDVAYFIAIDAFIEVCAAVWQLTVKSFPKFLYSRKSNMTRLSATPTDYLFADIMTIFVTFTPK